YGRLHNVLADKFQAFEFILAQPQSGLKLQMGAHFRHPTIPQPMPLGQRHTPEETGAIGEIGALANKSEKESFAENPHPPQQIPHEKGGGPGVGPRLKIRRYSPRRQTLAEFVPYRVTVDLRLIKIETRKKGISRLHHRVHG